MLQLLVLNAALSMGQAPMLDLVADAKDTPAVKPMPSPAGDKAEPIKTAPAADAKKPDDCPPLKVVEGDDCCDKSGCTVILLKPWKCEDLEAKPVCKEDCGCGRNLLNCPKCDCNACETECAEDGVLMDALHCYRSCTYDRMCRNGVKAYGWLQQGYTVNFDGPRDRINFQKFNFRSNDYQLNQAYLVVEKKLEHDDFNIGYRFDFLAGTDAPFTVANGMFDKFTGLDVTSGIGNDGPSSFRHVRPIGADIPQAYVEAHLPVLGDRGMDVRLGKFYKLMGVEDVTATDTNFYSHSYEFNFAMPYTLTGAMATIHLTDTLDYYQGITQGWDAFEDNNSTYSYFGSLVWTSCDKRSSAAVHYITGPEQFNSNSNNRTVVAADMCRRFGDCDQWRVVAGGHVGWEEHAARNGADAEWYGATANVFYTVDPRLVLGIRGEWFRDDDGTRTAVLKRPGFAATFYEVTVGATYRPYKNLRLRPELRTDWFANGGAAGPRPYNDLTDSVQYTLAMDAIWDF